MLDKNLKVESLKSLNYVEFLLLDPAILVHS